MTFSAVPSTLFIQLIEGIEGRHMVHKKAYLSRYFDDEPPSAGRARSLK